MLYVTTRSSAEQYPALRTLGQDFGTDGGQYVPFQIPDLQRPGVSFADSMANLLNGLFLPKLDGKNLEFTLGKQPVRLKFMSHRMAVAECWHNPGFSMDWMTRKLLQQFRPELETASRWGSLAARMGILAGSLDQLIRENRADADHPVDISVPTGDFSWPMAAWYVRALGWPVGRIICSSRENSAVWDLLRRGELRTRESEETDGVLRGLERLISACLGPEEARAYDAVCGRKGLYKLRPDQLEQLQRGLFAAVISSQRMERVIANVCSANGYILSEEAALAYAGLQDYRATDGESRLGLIVMESSPACAPQMVARALGLTEEELKNRLDFD